MTNKVASAAAYAFVALRAIAHVFLGTGASLIADATNTNIAVVRVECAGLGSRVESR